MNMIVLRDQLRKSLEDEQGDGGLYGLDDGRDDCQVVPPSPREIRERCAEIQREWSPRERMKRAGYRNDPTQWHPPVVTTADLDLSP